jgi:hypothetical protein
VGYRSRAYWAGLEYLALGTSAMHAPALVTTSPTGTAQEIAGVIGPSTTTILFGDAGLNRDLHSGGRITLGRWLDCDETRAVVVSYMILARTVDSFSGSQAGYPILARPFCNLAPFDLNNPGNTNYICGLQDAHLINYPNVIEGSLSVRATTQLQGAELLLRQCAGRNGAARTDFVVGYRWLELKDALLIDESTLSLSGATQGTHTVLFDHFNTTNTFHGAEIGVVAERPLGPNWSIELLAKIALGSSSSLARINGQTATTLNGTTEVTSGGLLTQTSNIGSYSRNSFAGVTEIGAELRRRVSRAMELNVGYTLIYLSDVGRAGEQVDLDANLSQVPPDTIVGAARPRFALRTTDFWAQGLHAGLVYSF